MSVDATALSGRKVLAFAPRTSLADRATDAALINRPRKLSRLIRELRKEMLCL
jgi:hypothetical protein